MGEQLEKHGDCDHEPVDKLNPNDHEIGAEVVCSDCGLGFICRSDGVRRDRYFVAATVEPDYTDPENSQRTRWIFPNRLTSMTGGIGIGWGLHDYLGYHLVLAILVIGLAYGMFRQVSHHV